MVRAHHLPATWRTARAKTLAVLAVIFLGLFSWLALSATHRSGPALYDQTVTDWAITVRTAPMTAIMDGFSALGSTPGLTILTLVCVPALVWAGRRTQAAGLALAMIGSSLLTVALKLLFGRERPSTHTLLGDPALTLSFPSGHSFNTAVFAGALACCVLLGGAGLLGRVLAVVAAVGTTAMVGASRVYLGYHWMTDVLAGWSLGVAWLCLVALAILWLQGRRYRPGEASAAGPAAQAAQS